MSVATIAEPFIEDAKGLGTYGKLYVPKSGVASYTSYSHYFPYSIVD